MYIPLHTTGHQKSRKRVLLNVGENGMLWSSNFVNRSPKSERGTACVGSPLIGLAEKNKGHAKDGQVEAIDIGW